MTAAHAGQAIAAAILCYGIFQIAIGLFHIVQTALFRMRLRRILARASEDWPKGYNDWKARQAA